MCLGVGLVVDLHQPVDADVGIFLGGGERGVAEQLLNGAQVGAAFQHVGGKGMPQGMRRDPFERRDPQDVGIYDPRYAAAVYAAAARVDKKSAPDRILAPLVKIFLQRLQSAAADRDDTLLTPLAGHPYHAGNRIELPDIESGQLGNAETA